MSKQVLQQLSSVSLKLSRLEQYEKLLSVEQVLAMERVRFEDRFTGITGFHDLGTELHLLLELQGSSNPKKVWSPMSKKVFLTTTAIYNKIWEEGCNE